MKWQTVYESLHVKQVSIGQPYWKSHDRYIHCEPYRKWLLCSYQDENLITKYRYCMHDILNSSITKEVWLNLPNSKKQTFATSSGPQTHD